MVVGATDSHWARARTLALSVLAAILLAACSEAAAPTAAPNASAVAPTASSLQGFHRVFDQPHLTCGHPLTLFVGGQFCPFCASMRWPLVKALSRFGTFTGLGQIDSQQGTDGFRSIGSYDLTKATFKSDYVTLRVVEVADVNGNPLQRPDAESASLVNSSTRRGRSPSSSSAAATSHSFPTRRRCSKGKASSRSWTT